MAHQRRSQFWDDAVQQFDPAINSLDDVAQELGRHKESVRHAFAKRGVRLTAEANKSIRARVEAMKPHDAIEFLLGVLEQVSWVDIHSEHPTDHIEVRPAIRPILRILWDASGRTVSKDHLLTAYTARRSIKQSFPDAKIIDIQICHLRKALAGTDYEIKTVWGVGYRLLRRYGTTLPSN